MRAVGRAGHVARQQEQDANGAEQPAGLRCRATDTRRCRQVVEELKAELAKLGGPEEAPSEAGEPAQAAAAGMEPEPADADL